MNIGILKIHLRLPENLSLKGKRQVLKSIIALLRNKFNVSVAEVADNDLWQLATIAVAVVSNDQRFTNEVLSKAVNFVEGGRFEMEFLDYEIEIIPVSKEREDIAIDNDPLFGIPGYEDIRPRG